MYSTTGLTQGQIVELCARVRARANQGDPVSWPPILGLFKSVVVVLTYLRRNRVQAEIGETYGVSQPTISRAVTGLTAVLGEVVAEYVPVAEDWRRTWTRGPSTSWTARSCPAGHGTTSGSCTRASTRRPA
jgi:hypothetical protein